VARSASWLLGGVACLLVTGLLCTVPAFACSLINVEASIANATALSARYWIASILLGGVLIGLEFRQRQFWLFPGMTLALLVFHPHWTLPSFFGPDCVFPNVRTSEVVLATIALMFGYRIVGHMLTQRQRVGAAALGVGVGGLAAGAAAILVLLPRGSVNLRYVLPELVPWLLLTGIATGFLVALGLGATRAVNRISRG
jgi:hypothetical protein